VSLGWFLTLGIRIVYPALLPKISAEFGLDAAASGLLLSALWATYAVLQFPGGVVADIAGERVVLSASLAGTAVAVAAIVVAPTLTLFVIATIGLGVTTGFYGTTRLTILAATFDRMQTTAISVSQAAGNVGNVLLAAGAGVVSVAFGWRWGFGYVLPGMIVLAIGLPFVIPARSADSADGSSITSTMRTVLATVRRPRVLAVFGLLTGAMFLYQSVTGFLPTYLVVAKGLEPGTAAGLFSVFLATAIGVQFLAGILADRRGNAVAIGILLGAALPAFVLLATVETLPGIIVAVVLASTVLGAMPPVNAAGVGALPEAVRGSGFGLLRTGYIVIGATGPPIVGLFADAGRFDLAFIGLGGLAGLTAVWGMLVVR
ncbi:MAG: nitrate/nitrite transporter, partial [Salinirussus sp.]